MTIKKRVTADYEITKAVYEINAIKHKLKKTLIDSGLALVETSVVWKEILKKIK